MGNSNWRLQTTLDIFGRGVRSLGYEKVVELVVVDWASARPLHLDLALSPEASGITRFILVPESVHERVRGDSSFPGSIAVNAGVRRSRGKWVAQSGNDTLWCKELLRDLIQAFEGRISLPVPLGDSLASIPRKHIPVEMIDRQPSPSELESLISKYHGFFPQDALRPFYLTPAGAILMPRELWLQCRGLDERMIHWGMSDADLTCRIRLHYQAQDLGKSLGNVTYHMQHSRTKHRRVYRERQLPFGPFAPNDPDWGLGAHSLDEFPPSTEITGPPAESYRRPPEIVDPRRVHLTNILAAARSGAILDAADAYAHFVRSGCSSPRLRKLLSGIRPPQWMRRTPPDRKKIAGPWSQ